MGAPALAAAGIAAFAVILAAAYFSVGWYFYRFAVARNKKDFIDADPGLPGKEKTADPALDAWWAAQTCREVRLRSPEGLSLYARVFPAAEPTDLVVVLAHGYSGTGNMMKPYARMFRGLWNCHLVVPDLRGHGKSDGKNIGFGLAESEDLRLWLSWIEAELAPSPRIVLHGVSMGGAAVCTLLGSPTPASLRCAVSDCSYADAQDVLGHKLKDLFGLPPFPVLSAAAAVTRILAGYRLADASPRRSVAAAGVPTLFIHGGDDAFVPLRMGLELHAAAACPKTSLVVPGAAHADSLRTAPELYAKTVADFAAPYLAPRA